MDIKTESIQPTASARADRRFTADRDSVSAGDDCQLHEVAFAVPPQASVQELVRIALTACRLASIAGGQATWIVQAGGYGGSPLAVVAQQWAAPRFLAPAGETVERFFSGCEPRVFFRYWCQADPQTVFDALAAGTPLPARHG
ncbi:hypothetical protein ACG04R_18390 [Roseateles sp. BYS78W]|uniref:Uncharacterized protein n=1 Tax=Pelomonas candidula TaxID=3299025 RepID=A0ABW7HFH5_9BURK